MHNSYKELVNKVDESLVNVWIGHARLNCGWNVDDGRHKGGDLIDKHPAPNPKAELQPCPAW
jgi:hypothetical protein